MDKQCVFCVAETEFHNNIYIKLELQRVHIPVSPCMYTGLSVCMKMVMDRCENVRYVSLTNAIPPMSLS
jgi:multimeric flavodoxin WrbA